MSTVEDARGEQAEQADQRVAPLELFFDLVFVFAITQVTGLMSVHPSWQGLAQGMLVLGAIWWAWVGYSWMTNAVDTDEGLVRVSIFAAMAAMLVAALAAPHAFGRDALVFGVAYFFVRLLHIVIYAQASHDAGIAGAVKRLAPTLALSPALIVVAGLFDDTTTREVIWLVALVIDFVGPVLAGMEGWRIFPGHFAERHALIVIIALGESIVAVGVGVTGKLDASVVTAAVLGVVISAGLWWTYFDVVAIVAERRLREAVGLDQVRMARDSFSYLHFPMIAGIVLLALGVKKSIGHVDEPLATVPAFALCAGPALYLLGHVAFRLRNVHTLARRRLVVAALLLAYIPLATETSALVALGAVALTEAALLGYEVIRFRESRSRLYATLRT